MKEKFLNHPNLPTNKVTSVFAHVDDNALKKVFDKFSIKVIDVCGNRLLDIPVSKHADILTNYVGNSTFLIDKNQIEFCNFIKDNGGKYADRQHHLPQQQACQHPGTQIHRLHPSGPANKES